ncbi:MAG: cobalamin biosynthesis bifunctional protein CbiET [Pelagibacteraceae bacterium]|nr:cobalamin biosynthesis bifunctional protein CbiET [Pelagibacteraceae bacterium]PPR10894.1 MAG: Precorrin-6Y C(5,15)-methyltransferase [decarboxylating] [Alphaproteobacteria bacterium MarineAlpha11_Bin1]|tara:strand:- start:1434 stop:2642 length:1209 start_codon:yes stop_codon:yes gene_type:complete
MKDRWLSVVGIGEDGLDGLTPRGRMLIDAAEILIGGERHLAMLPDDDRERLTWTRPLTDLMTKISEMRGRLVCVLATGDPMFFGIGVTLLKHFAAEEMDVVPSLSAFTLAAARLRWALADVDQLTLHGRPASLIVPFIQPGSRLLILADGSGTPAQVADILTERGYGDSEMTVLEHMGGACERQLVGDAGNWDHDDIAAFHTLAVNCVAGTDAVILPRIPGLPDEAFSSDGNITKREVRAFTLSALAPVPGQHLWDIGAGCGSVAIEWMRTHPACRASAIESRADRIGLIARNAVALGVPRLRMIEGEATEVLAQLDAPDAVFVGGGGSNPELLDLCWKALKPGGRLVANAVTLESEGTLAVFREAYGGNLARISISRAEPVGSLTGWRPTMPVTQLAAVKI